MLSLRRLLPVLCLLLAVTFARPVVQAQDQPAEADIVGRWLGELQAGGERILAELRVARDAEGNHTARLLVPLGRLNWVPVEAISVVRRGVTFRFANAEGTQLTGRGTLSADGQRFSGAVVGSQGNRTAFTFHRVPYLQGLDSYERWRGQIVNILDGIVVELAKLPDGRLLGALTGPDPEGRLQEFPLHDITSSNDGQTLTIKIRTTSGRSTIVVTRSANGRRLDGTVQTERGATQIRLERDFGLGGGPDTGETTERDAATVDHERWLGSITVGEHTDIVELRLRDDGSARMSWIEGGFVWKDVRVDAVPGGIEFAWGEGDQQASGTASFGDDESLGGTLKLADGTTATITLRHVPAMVELQMVEAWHARLGVGDNELNVMLRLGYDAAGNWFGDVSSDLPTQDTNEYVIDVPLKSVIVEGELFETVRAVIPSRNRQGAALELTRGDTQMTGYVITGGNRTPLRFRLLERVVRPQASEPDPDLPTPTPTDSPAAGRWLGTVQWGEESRIMEIRLGYTDGEWKGRIAFPQAGIPMSPLDGYEFSGRQATLRLDIIDGDYPDITTSVTVANDGKTMAGTVLVDGNRYDCELRGVPFYEDATDVSIWNGHIDANGTKFEINVTLGKDGDGNWMGSFDFVADGYLDLPFLQVEIGEDRKWKLTLPTPGLAQIIFGQVSEDGQSFSGTLMAGATFLPVELKRVEQRRLARRPQEPQPPYPYDEHEVTFENPNGGHTLAGTLTTPRAGGPFPAVVLISGSGPQDRNEKLMGHKPFAVLADYLTRRGLAVLRYDDRGTAKSTGTFAGSTTRDLATDAGAAVAFLKTRDEVNHETIGLIGHSEGGIIAPMIAASQPEDIAFIVLLAGPGVSGADIILAQTALIAAASGGSDTLVEAQEVMLRDAIRAVREDGLSGAALRERVTAAVETFLAALPEDERAEQPAAAALAQRTAAAFDDAWMRFFLSNDPAVALARVQCPVLAMNGTKDLQVPWQQNLPVIFRTLVEAGNDEVTIRAMKNLNHLFQTADTGTPSEYGAIEETFAPAALEVLGEWIEFQLTRSVK